ncbi:hypothetical protein RN346_04635 [Halomonas sp. PAMB 3232]|uniref:hypothetical protein n=1 Tax=Halomonas sp. PAMB 3232 TaxID=3075221 RepID=UPI00289A9BFC|nr:hypothetical protein [Halomonas sp. PAMB 3232]WNL39848.1 hypothetical protein RN346_04635 [Halomonas sp. PAMB 3232]
MSKFEITSMSVAVDKEVIGQAFTTLAAPIIGAKALLDAYGEETAKKMLGLKPQEDLDKAGEVVLGTYNGLVCRLVIEPESGSWVGGSLTHEPVKGITIQNMEVNGEQLKAKV